MYQTTLGQSDSSSGSMPSRVPWVQELRLEEREHSIERGPRRLTRLVDEIYGEHRVVLGERTFGVAIALMELDRDEAIPQSLAQVFEALARDHRVTAKPEAQDLEAFLRAAIRYASDVRWGAIDAACARLPQRKRKGRLRHHWGEDARVFGHGEREPTREAHSHDAHTRTTAAVVLFGGESAQVIHDG
jgi:hypothetical protein